jgi:flagellar protein FlaG
VYFSNVSKESSIPNVSYVENVEVKTRNNNTTSTVNDNSNMVKKGKLESKKYTEKDVEKGVKKLNKFLEDEKVHAEYSVHKDLKTIIIKIVDDDTKKVVLEVPSEKILDMIASMCRQVGILDKKA